MTAHSSSLSVQQLTTVANFWCASLIHHAASPNNLQHFATPNRDGYAEPWKGVYTPGQRSSWFLQHSHERVGRIFQWGFLLSLAKTAGDIADWLGDGLDPKEKEGLCAHLNCSHSMKTTVNVTQEEKTISSCLSSSLLHKWMITR